MERLKISRNGRYFEYADGTPFIWLADTVWTMPQRMKWDDVDFFLQVRKSQGFSVLQMVALDPERDVAMRNPCGEMALHNQCLDTPNEAYFLYLDWILDKAEEYGFYVLLLPVWGQLVVGDNWMGETFKKTVTEENAYDYGRWIGNRYKNRNHVIWCLGGDRQPIHKGEDYRNVWRKMAEGLAKGVLGEELRYYEKNPKWNELQLTYHACHEMETGECSTMSYWTEDEAWIRFIMLQSGHGEEPKNYDIVKKEYDRERPMPVWDGEPAYEMMPTTWPKVKSYHGAWMVRKRAYWSLFAGSFGHTYGHASVWCSISEKERNEMTRYSWFEALRAEGAEQMKFLRDFLEARPICKYIPCQEILLSQSQMEEDILNEHKQACVNTELESICVYFPSGGEEQIDVRSLAQSILYLWWYNPRDGKCYDEEGCVTKQPSICESNILEIHVESPTCGEEEDWILIVEATDSGEPVYCKNYFEIETDVEAQKVFEWREKSC